jgi:hypothetical protein
MGGKGGGGTTIQQPPPIDPGKAMGEYLFGRGFTNYQGVTDPQLQNRLISAERTYRPQYTALELADINVMAKGIEGGSVNPEYELLEARLAGLEAGAEAYASSRDSQQTSEAREKAAAGMFPYRKSKRSTKFGGSKHTAFNREQRAKREAFIKAGDVDYSSADRAAEIAQVKTQLRQTPKTLGATSGLFDLLEDQSARAGALQREQLGLQRADDVSALQEFAPQVVEAYRDADPYSTEIAESMSRKAMGQLTPEEQRGIDQRARQGSLARGRIGDQSSLAAEALGRSDYTAQFAQPAFGMNRQLAGDVGMTILGRPSSSIGLGSQMLGQAQQGAAGPMGPQLFDPNVGINMAMQEQSNQVSLLGAQAQANAARSAGKSSMLGSIGGAALGLINPIGPCWVAREVYGPTNPQWLEFREWMLNDAPSWLRNLYVKYGERTAKFISNKPRVKSIIRKWMNTKIK